MIRYPPFAVLHLPHDSLRIPDEIKSQFVLRDDELNAELLRMTDTATKELYTMNAVVPAQAVAPVSRLVVDMERFDDDALETMAQVGMGVVYVKTSMGLALRRPISSGERSAVMSYYYNHHNELIDNVCKALVDFGHCAILDCHSFPSIPLPYEDHQELDRPDICIGTDSYHTPAPLAERFRKAFARAGFTVRFDFPFSGSLVPMPYYRKDARVSSIMVEVNRKLYMDEASGRLKPDFSEIAETVTNVCAENLGSA